MRPPDAFHDRVLAVLRGLKSGEVVTYGEVAAEAGSPGAARAVGQVLRRTDQAVPWWRVVTASGRLAPGKHDQQARLLADEGVTVVEGHVRRVP